MSKHTDPRRWASGDRQWRQLLHFYSDNNSCLRRSVWQELPLPDINYGEDQAWAAAFLKRGYAKVFAPSAAVYHSHDLSTEEAYQRSSTEAAFFEQFGYQIVDPKRPEGDIKARDYRDRRWALENNVPLEELEKQFAINRAMVLGAAEAIAGRR